MKAPVSEQAGLPVKALKHYARTAEMAVGGSDVAELFFTVRLRPGAFLVDLTSSCQAQTIHDLFTGHRLTHFSVTVRLSTLQSPPLKGRCRS